LYNVSQVLIVGQHVVVLGRKKNSL